MKKIFFTTIIILLLYPIAYSQEYLVGEGDLLKITVYNQPDLASVVRISASGKINFPLIGEIAVGGLSIAKVKKKIEGLLADGYIINPSVSILIQEFKSKKVIVMGEVNKPGLVELRGDATLLEVISKVGGITDNAGDVLYIQRMKKKAGDSDDKDKESITVDLKRLLEGGAKSANMPIEENDSIYVPRSAFFFVNGEVNKPGSYKIIKGITVLKAISIAGGLTDNASETIEIIRKVNKETIKVDFQKLMEGDKSINVSIEKEDSIYVSRAAFFFVNGEVKKPGSYKIKKGITVLKAITIAGGFTDKAAKKKVEIIRGDKEGEEVKIKVRMNDLVEPEDIVFVPESFF